jgi:hypothetical protein
MYKTQILQSSLNCCPRPLWMASTSVASETTPSFEMWKTYSAQRQARATTSTCLSATARPGSCSRNCWQGSSGTTCTSARNLGLQGKWRTRKRNNRSRPGPVAEAGTATIHWFAVPMLVVALAGGALWNKLLATLGR